MRFNSKKDLIEKSIIVVCNIIIYIENGLKIYVFQSVCDFYQFLKCKYVFSCLPPQRN